MKIFTSNLARWIYFIPAFLICYIISIPMALWVLTWFYDATFPIQGFGGYLFSGLGISFIIATPLIYAVGLVTYMKICPNYKIGSRIIFLIIIPIVAIAYITKDHDFSLTKVKMEATLDIFTFLTLLSMCFIDFSEPTE